MRNVRSMAAFLLLWVAGMLLTSYASGFDSKILDKGDGWMTLGVEGRVDGRDIPRQIVYRMDGLDGVRRAPLPDEIKTLLSRDPYMIKNPGSPVYFHEGAVDGVTQFIRDHVLSCSYDLEFGLTCRSPLAEALVAVDTDCPDTDEEQVLSRDLTLSFQESLAPGVEELNGGLTLVASVTGLVTARVPYRVKMLRNPAGACRPAGFFLKPITISGEPRLNLDLTAVSLTFDDEKTFPQLVGYTPIHELPFMVGPIPVNIDFAFAAKVGVTVGMAGTGKITVGGPGPGWDLHIPGGVTVPVTFSYTCDPAPAKEGDSRCTGDAAVKKPEIRSVRLTGLQVSGKGWLKPWFAGLFRVGLYLSVADNMAIGLAPYMRATLWGDALSWCDLDGDGQLDDADGLLLDGDIGLMVQSGLGADWLDLLQQYTPAENPFFFTHIDIPFHGGFFDVRAAIGSAGSGVLTPLLFTPVSARVGEEIEVRFMLNRCYPYDESMDYQVDWGDGSSTTLTFAPHGDASLRHTYVTAGTKTVQLTAIHDSHSRSLNRSVERRLRVDP